jgi:response regulator of citrate/malate metabolism
MKKPINVLVIDDNEYYNKILSDAILQSAASALHDKKYKLVVRSFTDAGEYIKQIKSGELRCEDSIMFVDYYLGKGINGAHIIKLMKESSCDSVIVLLSQSNAVKDKNNLINYDYFVVKDNLAPALCCLYLKQFIENKYSISLD